MRTEALTLLLAGEDERHGHAEVVVRLVDRRLLEKVTWIDEHILDHVRSWLEEDGRRMLRVKDAWRRAREARLPMYGHFDGGPGAPEAGMWRAVLLLARNRPEPPHVVVLARDLDGKEERLRGMLQAIQTSTWPFAVVVAAAQPEIEAWVLIGFEPQSPADEEALSALKKELSFDPLHFPERLSSTSAARDVKRVLERLVTDRSRWEACCDAPFERLLACGRHTGFPRFIEAVDEHIVAKFGRPPAR